jgi:hypothetical protein
MLKMLETGWFDRAVRNGRVNLVIYQGLIEHVGRIGGSPWDRRGPRYVMTADNQSVAYAGPFHGDAYVGLVKRLEKSEIYSYFTPQGWARVEDLPLYVAVLKQAQREVERRYGAGSFVILMWYDKSILDADPTEQFREAGLHVIPINRVIPDINENRAAYVLADEDWHPNALANQKIAEFLAHAVGPQHCYAGDRSKTAVAQ